RSRVLAGSDRTRPGISWVLVEPAAALRSRFHDELAAVDAKLSELVHLVCQEVTDATEALLRDDRTASVEIVSRKNWSDPLYEQVAQQVEVLMARQAPMASDLRYLLAVVRAIPELEQSAGLAAEIAWRGGLGISGALTPRARALVTRSGDIVTAMWQELRRAWDFREVTATSLDAARDELRDLHTSLIAEVASSSMSASVTMDMALIGRFYERLGDHAVNIAGRLDSLNAWAASPGVGSAPAVGGASSPPGTAG
ncbi:MAG: phosphate transport system protein, partial [Acidimicrobiaceae bacterium]|nr:phosphate transport system protein [Acidimicrobiaceae bacterium]